MLAHTLRATGSVLDDVARSTAGKAREIVALRREVAGRDGARLAACAADLTERFAAGGTLLACGNGGSSSDAQEGEVCEQPARRVLGRTTFGGHRMIDLLVGDPPPRIC